jgi:predicted amidohydrolase
MKFLKVAAIQPESIYGENEYQNALNAPKYLEEAAYTGAQLICFPEGYPGPAHGPLDSKGKLDRAPMEFLCDAVQKLSSAYVAASNVELVEGEEDIYYLCQKLIDPNGRIIGDHKRVQPDEPDLNEYLFNGKRDMAPGNQCVVCDTEIGKIGLLICSELWVPELARIETLMGAEIIVAPVNGFHEKSMQASETPPIWETWKCISRSRAAENCVYVIVTQNVFIKEYSAVGHIAGPERMLTEFPGVGVFTAELDMERLHWLRDHSYSWEILSPPNGRPLVELPIGTRPGQYILRRPEVYQKLLEPLPSDWDYFYYEKERAVSNGSKVKKARHQRGGALI